MKLGVAGLVLATLLAGCVGPGPAIHGDEAFSETFLEPDVFVALLDSGINPWHEVFAIPATWQRQPPPVVAEAVPQSFRQRIAEEGLEAWNRLERERLYWFEGTRVLAISKTERLPPEDRLVEKAIPPDPHLIYDDLNHGTATASIIARAAPNAWIVMVEAHQLGLPGYVWASEEPWIDVISVSLGNLGHVPNNVTSERDAAAAAFYDATARGKLVFVGGGNQPDPNLLSEQGAPWVISVGAAEPGQRGPSFQTSQPVDVVANFTVSGLARNDSDTETFTATGTSFGTPTVAAAAAEAIHAARGHYGHVGGIAEGALVHTASRVLTNQDFRWALNLSAWYWNTTEWRPDVNTSQDPVVTLFRATNPALPHVPGTPVGPWVQMGWGYVDGSTSVTMTDLLTGATAPPDKRDAALYLKTLFEARALLWDVRQRG